MPNESTKKKARKRKAGPRGMGSSRTVAGGGDSLDMNTPARREEMKVVCIKGRRKLKLRDRLRMPRKTFGRLINLSERAIAELELSGRAVRKPPRAYLEVKRLCDALGEVVERDSLGDWFDAPNAGLDGLKPMEVIERGEIDRLWEMYYRLRSGLPA